MNDNQTLLSLFRGVHDTLPRPVTLDELVTIMRSDQSVRDLTEKHRYALSVDDKQSAKRYKHMMASFGVAATFEGGRQQRHIVECTGMSLVDIDHIEPSDMVRVLSLVHQDPHTLLAYVTMSGKGVRVLVRYTLGVKECSSDAPLRSVDGTSDYEEQRKDNRLHSSTPSLLHSLKSSYPLAFSTINEYYQRLTGLPYDPQCKNVNRISTIAYDEQLYYNPEATPFTIQRDEKQPVGRPKKVKSEKVRVKSARLADMAASVLAKVEAQGIRYEPGTYNAYVSRACYEMNRLGVPEGQCREWAVSRFADYDTPEVEAIVRSCYLQTEEHGTARRSRKGERKYATVDDIEQFLAQRIELRYNTIARMVELRSLSDPSWLPLQDKDLNSLWREMSKQCGVRVVKDDLCSVIRSDFAPQYNPFEEYIRSLPAWDGVTDYIGRLAMSVTVEGDAHEWCEVFRKWFVGFIAGLFMPDEINHGILVFIGEQGKYKSTWFYYLLPEELRRYFLIKLMDGYITKDDLFNIAQSALVCLEEIDNMKQKELNQLKALTTMRTISARPAYGRFNEHLPHIASFCATGNNPFFLTADSTNRRFLTFEVLGIEPPQEYDFQYEGLYAQAYALWKQGFRYWFNEEDNRATSRRNRDFEAPDRERELIAKYYRIPMAGEACKFLTASDILERIGTLVHGLNVVKVGMAMNALGHKRIRLHGKYGYRVVEFTPADIENRQRLLADMLPDSVEEPDIPSPEDAQQNIPF